MSNKKSNISVVIPAYNAEKTLDFCLKSLQSLTPAPLEIIVVDDGSTDNTVALAKNKKVKVIELEKNAGPGQARNQGAQAAKGEFIAFTDSDCMVPQNWLSNFETEFISGNWSGITGPYSGPVEPHTLAVIIDRWLRFNQRKIPKEIVSCISANLFVKRKDFLELGGFPSYCLPGQSSYYWGNEDEEFAWLLAKKTGLPFLWMKYNGCKHNYRSSIKAHYNQQKFWVKSILISMARFPELSKGESNYSSLGPVISIIITMILFLSIVSGFLITPYYFIGSLPFFLYHIGHIKKITSPEQGHLRKTGFAINGWFFIAITSVAWFQGLLTGSWMYLKCRLVWGKENYA